MTNQTLKFEHKQLEKKNHMKQAKKKIHGKQKKKQIHFTYQCNENIQKLLNNSDVGFH